MALKDIVDVRVEFGLGPASEPGSLWDTALWDIGTWASSTIQWTDFTTLCLGVDTKTGKQAYLRRSRAGTATFTMDNTDGLFIPGAELPGFLNLRPGRYARLTAKLPASAAWIPLWFGRIDSIDNSNDEANLISRIRCTDAFGELAVSERVPITAVGAGETADARINRVLDYFDWPADARDIQASTFTLQETTMETDALELMQLARDSSGGDLWMGANGDVIYRPRGWLPVDVTWELGSAGGVPLLDADTEWSIQRVVNSSIFGRVGVGGGFEQTSSASVNIYGLRTVTNTALICDNDPDVITLGADVINKNQWDRIVVLSADVSVEDEASAVFATDVQIGDLIQVTVSSMFGTTNAYLANVISISDMLTPTGWVVSVGLDDSEILNQYGSFSRDEYDDAFHLGGTE